MQEPLWRKKVMPQRDSRMAVQARPICLALLVLSIDIRCSAAELGPCTTAAPTTPAVIAFASNIDRSVRWYRENIGLEMAEPEGGSRLGDSITLTARNGTGVTLAPLPGTELPPRDPQAVCFVLDDPPAPSPGSKPVFLADPDGTSVELPPRKTRPRN